MLSQERLLNAKKVLNLSYILLKVPPLLFFPAPPCEFQHKRLAKSFRHKFQTKYLLSKIMEAADDTASL